MSHSSNRSPDLAVVGGGVVGLAIAWRARQRGLDVAVYERGELGGGASGVAAGMLAPVTEATFGEQELVELNLDAAARWPAFAAELEGGSGARVGYRRCGTLLVAGDRDAAEALERELELRRSLGLRVERLLPSDARRREAALAPVLRAVIHAPDDHAVDPRALTRALAASLERDGASLHRGAEVVRVRVEAGRCLGLALADGSPVDAAHTVIAAGCWSSQLPGIPAEARVPVRPVKGQILRLRDPAGPGLLSRVVRFEGVYLVPRGDGRYVLGATVEERGFDTAVTAGALHELLREAAEIVPGVVELELEEASAGLRPGTPDNAPIVGPSPIEQLHWATGHYRNGVLHAPLTADLVVAAVTGEELPSSARRLSPRRFAPERGVVEVSA